MTRLSPRERWTLGAILVAGAVLRWIPATWMSYFGDEVYSLRAAEAGPRAVWAGAGSDIHPPLFNLLLSIWLQLCGEWPEWRPRILPIAIGLFWVLATHRLARASLSSRGSLIAAAVVAFHPMAVLFTEPVRWYGLFALAATMVVYSLQRSLAQASATHLVWLAVWLTVALWAHSFGWVLWLGSLGAWVWHGIRARRFAAWRQVGIAYAAAFLAGLPVLMRLVSQLGSGVASFDRTGLHAGLLSKPAYLLFALTAGPTSYPWSPAALAALAVLVVGLILALAQPDRTSQRSDPSAPTALSKVVAPWIPVLPVAAFVVTDYSAPHYYLVFLAAVAVLVGWLTEQRGLAARISVIGFAAAALIGVVHLERGRQFQREEYLDPWRDVVASLQTIAGTRDRVLVSHPSAAFYARDDARFRTVTVPGELPRALADFEDGARGVGDRNVLALVAPLSGAIPQWNALEHWLADSLEARGYRMVRDSGLVACDAPEARRRFSGRPFPEWRVRLLEWRSDTSRATAIHP